MQVPLADIVLIWHNPVIISSKEDTTALAAVLRLDDKRFGLALVKLLLE